jgi:acetyl esterase
LIPIAHQTLLHPILDTDLEDRPTASDVKFFDGPIHTIPLLRKSIDGYLPNTRDRTSELASPRHISAKHAKLQPTTLIVVSSADLLRDDGLLYGETLQRNGVDVAIFMGHGQVHDSEIFEATRMSETPRAVVRMVAGEIRNTLGAVKGMGKVNGHGHEHGHTRMQLRKGVVEGQDDATNNREKGGTTKVASKKRKIRQL